MQPFLLSLKFLRFPPISLSVLNLPLALSICLMVCTYSLCYVEYHGLCSGRQQLSSSSYREDVSMMKWAHFHTSQWLVHNISSWMTFSVFLMNRNSSSLYFLCRQTMLCLSVLETIPYHYCYETNIFSHCCLKNMCHIHVSAHIESPLLSALPFLPLQSLHDAAPAGFHYSPQTFTLQNVSILSHASISHLSSSSSWGFSSHSHIETTLMTAIICHI